MCIYVFPDLSISKGQGLSSVSLSLGDYCLAKGFAGRAQAFHVC